MFKEMFLIAGIGFIILDYKKYLLVETPIIIGCFVIWFVLLYWSIHKKNKDRRTPRAVYNVGQ